MARRTKILGTAELSRRLKAIPKEVRKASMEAVRRAADRMADDMRAMVPVDQGDLRTSIVVTEPGERPPSYSQGAGQANSKPIPDNAVAVTAGNSGVRYAHMVEFGTRKTAAQPFFLPAVRSNRPKARRAINSAISRAIRKAK